MSHTVGQNAPCPCGSGKRFKACCAKRSSGVEAWGPFRWIARLYRFFMELAEDRVRRGNWNRRPESYEGPMLSILFPGSAGSLWAFVWTCAVLVGTLIAVVAAGYWLTVLLRWS